MTATLDRIIVLDDDPMVEVLIGAATGKHTLNFSDMHKLMDQLPSLRPFAFFVDIYLGVRENGLDILPQLKQLWPRCPVIVMTADRNDNLIGQALAAGADDFIRKPLNPKELLARMQARLGELAKSARQEVLRVGDLTLDTAHRVLANADQVQRFLSPTEMNLLACLYSAQGTVVRRDVMKRKCWGQAHVSDNALNRKLHEVRKVLQDISAQVNIKTVYGIGAVLEIGRPAAKGSDADKTP